MHTNKAGAGRHFRDSKTLCTPLSGQFDINGVRLFPIAAQYCHLTRELQVDKLDRKWRVQYFVLALIIMIVDCIWEPVCVSRWRLVYPSLIPAASFSSLAVTAGQCVGYNQMEEWSEHNKYDWYSPAQAWPDPDNHQGFGRQGERRVKRFTSDLFSLDYMRFVIWERVTTLCCVYGVVSLKSTVS